MLAVVHSPGRRWPRRLELAAVAWLVLGPDQVRQQGDQAEAVEGGVVAGDRQPGAARPGDHPDRRAGGQVEAGDQVEGGDRVVVDDLRCWWRARLPGLVVQAGADHRDGLV